MPKFRVIVWRKVTESAEQEIEADTAEEAKAEVEEDLQRYPTLGDYDWTMCDCQDDGTVMSVTEIAEPAEQLPLELDQTQ